MTNGQVERYNRTVFNTLTAVNHGKPENTWDDSVGQVQWGLNNTVNQGTGKTPSQALYGVQLTGAGDAYLQSMNLNDGPELEKLGQS